MKEADGPTERESSSDGVHRGELTSNGGKAAHIIFFPHSVSPASGSVRSHVKTDSRSPPPSILHDVNSSGSRYRLCWVVTKHERIHRKRAYQNFGPTFPVIWLQNERLEGNKG